jgi:hypothetical protein
VRCSSCIRRRPGGAVCALDISLTGVYGWLQGGDQYGVLLGLSPKFKLWDTD